MAGLLAHPQHSHYSSLYKEASPSAGRLHRYQEALPPGGRPIHPSHPTSCLVPIAPGDRIWRGFIYSKRRNDPEARGLLEQVTEMGH